MSLNWKEINLVLSELDLEGAQIQKIIQSSFDILILVARTRTRSIPVLVSLSSGACRLHETFRAAPKSEQPLRFAEFLKSRIVNSWIEEAVQLGQNRVVRLLLRRGENRYQMYIRLWSNAANIIVTGDDGVILDAMRRLPKRGEVSGGIYRPEAEAPAAREYEIREFEGSFSEKLDAWYAEHGGTLSLEQLRVQGKKNLEGRMGRLAASLEHLREKEAAGLDADRLRICGDIILSQSSVEGAKPEWLETVDFEGGAIRIKIDGKKTPAQNAEHYYSQYRKAKNGLDEIRKEIASGEAEYKQLLASEKKLLAETNPLILERLLKKIKAGVPEDSKAAKGKKTPGLCFADGPWIILAGRSAKENDELLRKHVRGNDFWLHARDYAGSYIFIRQRAGKSVPLEILLDAGNLAVFYSKARNNGSADVYYTRVKYLRRAKGGPRGLVIPTQEKNLHITMDRERLKRLENS
ncbi:MAG: NFACT RNA binding domain-containing protein [Treponema sp.]|jgi:predicted ribosome quality control (RQC) complex YloA/Tae2 family protein|nr:NFACT RNA binding domain-containing protein [Treponema sp.]